MAQTIQLAGAGASAKIRSPVAVAILSIVTLGIYVFFWWYFINREMADYGRAKGTEELGTNPGRSVLALIPGALIIVPAIWTLVTTFKRIQKSQALTGLTPINGWLGAVLFIVLGAFGLSVVGYAYMQSGLNNAWKAQGRTAAPEPAGETAPAA
jgi:hypothetical protein